MVNLINKNSILWAYLTNDIKDLLVDGEILVNETHDFEKGVTDFSYMVFPFSKAYEGFLKKLFLDLKFIKEDEYYGDDIRIGRILNPGFVHEHENLFEKLCTSTVNGGEFAEQLWSVWKRGRNRVFHYFPHNFRKLTHDEATQLINEILQVMSDAVKACYVNDAVTSIAADGDK